MGLATYWHTLRHLKPIQISTRLMRKLPRRVRTDGPIPSLAEHGGVPADTIGGPATMVAPGVFRFLNEEHDLGWPIGWQAEGSSLLWRYNLHYFDDLRAFGCDAHAKERAQVLGQWIAANPPGATPAWDPYPVSLRLVNWIKWSWRGAPLPIIAHDSMAQQARWLAGHVEWHLLGNHLFANAKALTMAGCFFVGEEARAWLKHGCAILRRELPEQVLGDGGNFELSPMYHAIFLEDTLDLLNCARVYPDRFPADLVRELRDCAGRMLEWLAALIHPDGDIALFNDAALGPAPDFQALAEYALRLEVPVPPDLDRAKGARLTMLRDSGYARLEVPGAVAICDVARVGPDYLPGHAHADTLSFELSVHGRRVVVNGGTSRYGEGAERLRERGTAAHSTVTVDGADSSEVWGGFRVARRARPFDIEAQDSNGRVTVSAAHDGYRRIHRDIIHHRSWVLEATRLIVEDNVKGPWRTAQARFILSHTFHPVPDGDGCWLLQGEGPPIRLSAEGGSARMEPGHHSLAFGETLPCHVLVVELNQRRRCAVTIDWSP